MRGQGFPVDPDQLIKFARSNIKRDDIMHRGFLKPIEIALKTHKTEIMVEDNKLKPGSLPGGLKIAVRKNLAGEKRQFLDVQQIAPGQSLADLKNANQDNLLSMMKQKEGIELAICICMYSEDKKMLKNTLAGVSENIANLVALEKIGGRELDPDKIGVFIMMDGIEKVDPSVIDYFEELERSSNINLGDNIAPTLSITEMAKRASIMTEEEINQQEMKNVNNYLFDVAELEERNSLRFSKIRQDYDEIKDLLKKIKQLNSKRPLFDDLPAKLRQFFFEVAREQRKTEYAESDEQVAEIGEDRLIEQYAQDIRKMRPLVMKALKEGERYCKNYLSIRDDLAYLAYFRKSVPYAVEHLLQCKDPSHRATLYQQNQSHEDLNEELEITRPETVMNLFMCVKYKNSGKLSSHNWFFNGFCKELRPKYAVLLDVGLRPEGDALLKMYRYMKKYDSGDGRVGGVCGYMSLKIEKVESDEEVKDEDLDWLSSIVTKFTDIQRTQQVEYHFAHLMDKGFEASFGFIHVLPGAFSAYNMKAIIDYDNDEDDELLKAYFKSIQDKIANQKITSTEMGLANVLLRTMLPDFINRYFINVDPDSDEAMLYSENVYLAEDRILCMGIHKKDYSMAYLPDAYASVDPIKTVHGLLGQRKRWINGSYFAFEKVKKELSQHEKSIGCEFFLNVQIIYLSLMNSLSYFSPTFFLFTVHIAMDAFRSDVLVHVLQGVVTDPNNNMFLNSFVYTMDFIYISLIMAIVFYSLHLTNNNKRFKAYIYGISTLFGLFMICVFLVLIVDVFRGLINNDTFLTENKALIDTIPGGENVVNVMRWMLVASLGIYAVPILIYIVLFCKGHILCEIILGSFSFLFYGPTYLNILNIYSLCRIDDISWGTKGLDSGSTKNAKLKDSWRLIKFVHVAKYVIWNIVLGVALLSLGSSYTPRFIVTIIMVVLIGLSMSLKVVLSAVYMLKYWCSSRGGNKEPTINTNSRIGKLVETFSQEIMAEVDNHLTGIKEQYVRTSRAGCSFIQASRSKKNTEKAFKNQRQEQAGRSKIINKVVRNIARLPMLPVIAEEQPSAGKDKKKKDASQKDIENNSFNSDFSGEGNNLVGKKTEALPPIKETTAMRGTIPLTPLKEPITDKSLPSNQKLNDPQPQFQVREKSKEKNSKFKNQLKQ